MIYIEKSEEPEFLSEFKRKNPDKTYDSEEFAITEEFLQMYL